jgi:putative ATP-dependent endonuclease of OLD family
MIISQLRIENYRGIRALTIDFDSTTVIFGSNNTGKSTILAAIQAVLGRASGRRTGIFSEYDFHLDAAGQPTDAAPIVIELTFRENTADEWSDTKVQQLGPVIGIGADGLQVVTLRVTGRYDDALNTFTSAFDFLNPSGQPLPNNPNSLRRMQQMIPAFYLAALRDAAREFRANAPFWGPFVKALKIDPDIRAKIEEELAELNQQVLDAHEGFNSVKDRLGKSASMVPLGGGTDPVSIEALPNRVFDILARTQVLLAGVSGAPLPLAQHGEGTQSLAVICLFDAFLEARLVGEYGEDAVPILTLEEPEAHLHPSAVRAVGQLLAKLGGQKIITTHSGDLLASAPLTSLRRVRRRGNDIDVFRIQDGAIDPADLRRLDHHLRRLRGGVLFARVWILVEGETDETVIQEAARILGHDLFAMGICCFKFTELGIEPYIKLADALGIHWIAVADNDPAGQGYIATAQAMLTGRVAADHIVMLPAWDIETYLCISGYPTIYQNSVAAQKVAANPNPFMPGTADYWQHLVNKHQPGKGKPARVVQVIDQIEAQGAAGVPPFFGALVALASAKAHEGI